jgi:hypothetical protein
MRSYDTKDLLIGITVAAVTAAFLSSHDVQDHLIHLLNNNSGYAKATDDKPPGTHPRRPGDRDCGPWRVRPADEEGRRQ